MSTPFARTAANNIWKMGVIRLLYWMHFLSSVLIPFFRDWGGLDFTRIMLLNAWFMLCVFLLEVPTGTVADRFGRRASLALACPIGAVAVVLYTAVPHIAVFMIAELLFALSFTLMSGADEALVYDSLEEMGQADRSKRIFARLESLKLAGILLGALLGSVIAKYISLTAPLRLQAVPLVICLFVVLLLKEPATFKETQRRSYRQILVDGVRFFVGHPTLRVLAFDMVSVNAICWVIIWYYQALVEAAGLDLLYFGMVHAGMTVGQILILTNVERLERLLGARRHLLLLGSLIPGLCFLALGLTTFLPLVITGIMGVSYFGLSRAPLFASYMNKYIPSDKRATVLSTASMFRMLAIAVVNPLSGVLADRSLPNTMLVLGGVALLLGVVSRLRIREEQLIE